MSEKLDPTFEGDFTFATDSPFRLTNGQALQPVTLRYALYGDLDRHRDRVILVCHALSGNARIGDWWPQLFGAHRPFDTSRNVIIGINVLGSCYGSTGPSSINPSTGKPYGIDFPVVNIHDMVHAQARLIEYLGIDRLRAVVGGSIGGMQALAWSTEYARLVERCIVVGTAPVSALGLALSHLQRQAIRLDPNWNGGHYDPESPPRGGLALARSLAMCSYKSAELYDQRYHRKPDRSGENPATSHVGRFDIGGYLDYQGRIFNDRFDANCYLSITRAMDLFDLGSTPEDEASVMSRITARVLLIGISSDWLFPAADVLSLTRRMQAAGVDAQYLEMISSHGHDAFLADAHDLVPMINGFLAEERTLIAGGRSCTSR